MKTALTIVLSALLSAGVIAANQLGAQTTDTGVPPASTVTVQEPSVVVPAPSTTTTPTATTPATGASASVAVPSGIASVQNIVEITRVVPSGTTAVTAFTVPAGVVLVVTDLVITNTGTAATCGGALNRSGVAAAVATSPTTTTTTPTTSATAITTTPTTGTTATGTSPVTTTVAGTLTQTDSTVTGPLCVPAQTTTTLPLTTGIEFGAGQSVQLLNMPEQPAAGATAGTLGFHLRGILVTVT